VTVCSGSNFCAVAAADGLANGGSSGGGGDDDGSAGGGGGSSGGGNGDDDGSGGNGGGSGGGGNGDDDDGSGGGGGHGDDDSGNGGGGNGDDDDGSGGSGDGGNGDDDGGGGGNCQTCLDQRVANASFACESFSNGCGGTIHCACTHAGEACTPCPTACTPPNTSTCASAGLGFDAGSGFDASALEEQCCSLGTGLGGFCILQASKCPSLCDPSGDTSCPSGESCCQQVAGNKHGGVCFAGSCPAPKPDAG